MNFVLIIAVLCLCEQILSSNLHIGHYANITLTTCGLNAFSAKRGHKKCFKWHQSILEEKQSLRDIMYGRYVETGEFPFTVVITNSKHQMCMGSIISTRWILTSAHCFKEKVLTDIRVHTGITDWPYLTKPYIKAYKYIPHKNYKGLHFYDIGLIKLESDITIDINRANSVCLPSPGMTLSHSELATTTGWGHVNDREPNKRRLKVTQILVNGSVYDPRLEYITSTDLKYGMICSGDSGGPLVQYLNGRAVQIGINAASGPYSGPYRLPCGQPKYLEFSAVSFHLDWIIATIRAN